MNNLTEYNNTASLIPYHVYATSAYEFDWDSSAILKQAIIKGISFIPYVGDYLSSIIDFFWKDQERDIWQEILSRVQQLIEENVLKAIQGILLGDIAELKGKIASVISALQDHPGTPEAKSLYMSVSVHLDSVQRKFTTFDHKTNYHILSMYSTTALMQIMYWTMGIERKDEIGLNNNEVGQLQRNIDQLVKHVEDYIQGIYDAELDIQYNDSSPNTVANNVMYAHGYCRVHGLEYTEIIQNVQKNGSNTEGLYLKTLCYSTFFGWPTSQARILALKDEINMPEPFKPSLVNSRINQIKSLKGYIQRIGGALRVGGFEIIFANGNRYQQGTVTGESSSIELNGSLINTLETWGNGAIDEAKFTLSDGRTFTVGQRYSTNYRKFALDGHYISGIFVSSDRKELAGQAANICVSYHQKQ
ncbi:delta endotoxin%2C N-terminal domain [Yersinia nurmii]|uniref:Delta endotoxin, N-terminal domain n=1 Tax=Yersinia nurmii TaxID=685706 RepID=A0ABP1YBR2_9GAMM|nr:insecticidal delta-endotoxin Cry8Ea1 family protein [Yersinia nurmii]CNE45835.1 delta endotoxin%2C N-terminal domain [Yersinia nurmii]